MTHLFLRVLLPGLAVVHFGAAAWGQDVAGPALWLDFATVTEPEGTDRTGQAKYALSGGAQAVADSAFRSHVLNDLVVPHVPALSSPAELTLAAWVVVKKPAGFQTILYKGDRSRQPERIEYCFDLRDGYPEFKCKDAAGNWRGLLRGPDPTYNVAGFESVPALGAGRWQHVAVTFQHGLVTVCVDGTPVGPVKTDIETLVASGDDLRVGAGQVAVSGTKAYVLDGLIGDVRVYPRALSASELVSLHAASAPAYAERSVTVADVVNPDFDPTFERKLELTAEYEKAMPPNRVQGTGTRTAVQTHRGVPTLHVNGRPVYAMMMMPSPWKADGQDADVTRSCRDFAAAGIDMYTDIIGTLPYYGCTGWWLDEGTYDFTIVDGRCRALIAANPNALILPRLKMDPPKWWMDRYPDEHSRYLKDGKVLSGGGVSIASERWETTYERMLRDLIRHIETSEYADHVFGYMPAGGSASEWHWYGQDKGLIDYGVAARDRFRKWLREKYGADAALQTAWRRNDVTLNSAVFPDPETRRATECLAFRDPSRAAEYLDARRFLIDMVTRNVIRSCTIVKEATQGRKVAGVFYGYSLLFGGRSSGFGAPANNGQHDLRRVLNSPAVDFFSTPLDYGLRGAGHPGNLINAYTASLYLHGKFFFDEEDIRTYLYAGPESYRAGTRAETITVLQRALGWSLTKGNALWWFLIAGNATFHQEDIMRTIASLKKIGDAALDGDKTPVRDVALFADEESLNYLAYAEQPVVQALTWGSYANATRMGAPFDLYILPDVAMPNLPDYKVYIFLNAFYTTPALRRAIAAKVRRNHAVAVWLYAPGFVTDDGFSEATMRELTGITVRHEVKSVRSTLTLRDTGHAILAPAKTSPSLLPSDLTLAMGPVFWAEDPDVTVLGDCDGRAALVVKEEPEWRSIYSAFPLTKELLQGICDYAGVHVYNRDYDVFFANRGFAMLHATNAGVRTISLPEPCDVTELLTGQAIGRGLLKIETTVSAMDTRIFRLNTVRP